MRAEESARRVGEVRRRFLELELDSLLVTAPYNVRYVSGFSGSLGFLLIGQASMDILGDSRYWLQMQQEAPAFNLVRARASQGMWPLVTATSGLIEELRMVKTPDEVEVLRQVATIAGRAFDRVRSAIRPGLRERDVAFLLEQTFVELGADGPAFETIVAAGERGALPHGRASDRVLERGDMVVVDFGARGGGYNSDSTRTIVVGEPTTEQRRVIEAVQRAQQESMALMRPGVTADSVDQRAREVLATEAHAFGHGLGHGIGLLVHERPYLTASDQTTLQPGMVITNEPGIYIPDWGGVRLEEMVLITSDGPQVLTPASHQIAVG
jgi:Xaa-Pro aminopeptidase